MTTEGRGFRFGGEQVEYFALTAQGRSGAGDDFWDANWIVCAVEVHAGGFRGQVGGMIRAEELEDFSKQLERLAENLGGEAHLATMEDWLDLRLTGDGRGHIAASCRLSDESGSRNTLECRIDFDQTFLPQVRRGVARMLEAFPVLFRDKMT